MLIRQVRQSRMDATRDERVKGPFLQSSQTTHLCHCSAGSKWVWMFQVFARNGTKFKIWAWKVLLRMFNQEEGSVTAAFSCRRISDLCTYSHQSEGILVLTRCCVAWSTSERDLRLAACERGETTFMFFLHGSELNIADTHMK